MKKEGLLFVVAAPSGAGKTSLLKAILAEKERGLAVATSHTSRPRRPGEKDGVDYYFTPEATFAEMIAKGEFLEYARVHNHYYGTSRQEIARRKAEGTDIILEIDVQGAKQIKEKIPDAVLIFILPPSLHTLEERLVKRGQDAPEVIQLRLTNAKKEIAAARAFDYVVVNRVFAEAKEEISSIFVAERLAIKRNKVILDNIINELS